MALAGPIVTALLCVQAAAADYGMPSLKVAAETLHTIRKEKLDLVLPTAMRDNNVDMWIHVARKGNPDPMAPHFGSANGILIFTQSSDGRVERALFGGGGHSDLFDHFGSGEVAFALEGYEAVSDDVFGEITAFIEARNPNVIAVNYSDHYAVADGISRTQFDLLMTILGPRLSKRVISAEDVITDFRVRRVQSEVNAFARALDIHRRILERALSREIITPGVTTLADVGWWVAEEKHRLGLTQAISTDVDIPRILFSASGEIVSAPDARWWISREDYIIRHGDFMTFDISVRYLDYFTTDFKRNAYVMQPGETAIPEGIQRAFDNAIRAHDIMRPHILVGRTAKKTLESLVSALESNDYLYTPFSDVGTEDYKLLRAALNEHDGPGFSIDLHAMGNNAGSLVTLGASVAPFRSDRFDLTIQNNHLFSFEYMVHTALPERPGYPVSINIEGNHIVTERGVEYLHPRNTKIIIIR
jgi:methionine aminopeptidase